jgi:predicted glycogen debranching enzyme
MLPNRFPDAESPPEYNTVDATMWYFHAVEQTVAALDKGAGDALLEELVPVLNDVVEHHIKGTHYNIHVEGDGLLTSGAPGVQLTWMDARVGTRVVTPREGKPVEVNGLWLHGLCALSDFRARIGQPNDDLQPHIARAREAFLKYWNPETNALFDVLDIPSGGHDGSIRPNQLIALALSTCPLPIEQRRSAVRVAGSHLLTSHGMRSLSPDHPDYVGVYGGPVVHRDGCYHQGTTWGWLIGPWIRARIAVGDNPETVRSDLMPLLNHLDAAVIGSVSEVFDGNAPFTPRGAPAQAWSVAELLTSWDLLG